VIGGVVTTTANKEQPTKAFHMSSERKLRYAMVGGGQGAFIGAVHRRALALDGQFELVAGAFSSSPDRARASGSALGVSDDRNHGSWQDLLDDELRRGSGERVDLVCIVTPNHIHHPVALAFVQAGFHVVCDKPLVHHSAQADELVDAVRKAGTVFGVTYNYTGYPMVREARHLVQSGALGKVRKIAVEYNQGWLATAVEEGGANKQANWRLDPARSGSAGTLGDIGSHAENLAATVTGQHPKWVCADLTTFGAGRQLDDDAQLLLRYESGARGLIVASQVAAGLENDLRLQVSGTLGTITWRQEEPNQLIHSPLDGPRRILTRGSPWLSRSALHAGRIPAGHPEAFIEAFANIYLGVGADIRAHLTGTVADPLHADYPSVQDGARGVRFIERVVESAGSDHKWTAL
jgi:predicted dehydrogenase